MRRTPKPAATHWPAEPQLQPQSYGSSFEGLFGPAEPERVRYGVPQEQGSFPDRAIVGQAGHPLLTVQCGKFTAPVQREARQLHQEWAQQGNRHSFDERRAPKLGTSTTPAVRTVRPQLHSIGIVTVEAMGNKVSALIEKLDSMVLVSS